MSGIRTPTHKPIKGVVFIFFSFLWRPPHHPLYNSVTVAG